MTMVRCNQDWNVSGMSEDHDPRVGELLADGMRQVMRHVPATTMVITTAVDGAPHGMTATAFLPVSLAPPSVMIAVNRSASIYPVLTRRRAFAVNVLSLGADAVARAFSDTRLAHEERFACGPWYWHDRELPILCQARAALVCDVEIETVHGTHALFLGAVRAVVNDAEGQPALLYFNGAFASLGSLEVERPARLS